MPLHAAIVTAAANAAPVVQYILVIVRLLLETRANRQPRFQLPDEPALL
jgi:hypothetical protein